MYARNIADLRAKGYREIREIQSDVEAVRDVKLMSIPEIKRHLCEEGPKNCAECEICAYGREYTARFGKENGAQGITREQLMEKYGINVHDTNTLTHILRSIGQTPDRHPRKLYDEKKAVKALAGMWRGRAKRYKSLAEELTRRADEAERMAGILTS